MLLPWLCLDVTVVDGDSMTVFQTFAAGDPVDRVLEPLHHHGEAIVSRWAIAALACRGFRAFMGC